MSRVAGSTMISGPLPWRTVLVGLLAVSFALTLLSYIPPLIASDPAWTEETGEFRLFLDVVHDHNLPTWWNGVLLSTAAAAFLVAAATCRRSDRGAAISWAGLALVCLAMSLDDVTRVHERLDRITNRIVSPEAFPFTWLVLGVPIAVGVIAFVAVAARALPRSCRNAILVGFGAFFLGAIVLEAIGGVVLARRGVEGLYTLLYHLEEFLEMAGSAVLCIAPLIPARIERNGDIWRFDPGLTRRT